MPVTVFPAPGADPTTVQWNLYSNATTANSSASTVTIIGTTDYRWVGLTPIVNSGIGNFANNTIITSIANSSAFTVNLIPTVALSSANISIVMGNTQVVSDNSRTIGKLRSAITVRTPTANSSYYNTIGLSNFNNSYWTYFNNSNRIAVGNLNPKYSSFLPFTSTPTVSGANVIISNSFTSNYNVSINNISTADYLLITDTITGNQALAQVNAFSFSSSAATIILPQGQQIYTSTGSSGSLGTIAAPSIVNNQYTYAFIPNTNVTSVSVVAVGGGGASALAGWGGGGGGLGWVNGIPVTPGISYSVVVGGPGVPTSVIGADSYFINTSIVRGGGGGQGGANVNTQNVGGTFTVTNYGAGAGGGSGGSSSASPNTYYGGGSGAGGYNGSGGAGGSGAANSNPGQPAALNSGGGGGGGSAQATNAGAGGGVGLLGIGADGAGGAAGGTGSGTAGSGGSGGASGSGRTGGLYGGGGAAASGGSIAAAGGIRIMWGNGRAYGSTAGTTTLATDQTTIQYSYSVTSTISITIPASSVSNLNTSNPWTIQAWELDIFTQTNVLTNTAPITARDRYYYALLAKGRYGFQIPYEPTMGSLSNNVSTSKVSQFKTPNTSTEVFFSPSSSNLQKQIEQVLLVQLTSGAYRGVNFGNVAVIKTTKIPSTTTEVFFSPSSSNLQKQIEQVRLVQLTSSSYRGVNFGNVSVIKTTKIPSTTTEVFFTPSISKVLDNYVARGSASNNTLSIIGNSNATILQSSVSTIVAPTNARERYYYALLAKGRYGVQVPYEPVMADLPNNISANISLFGMYPNSTVLQSSVSTTVAPTNARERYYYALLAKGKYGVQVPFQTVAVGMANNIFVNKAQTNYVARGSASNNTLTSIGNANAIILQSSVSTIVAPTNARERYYYALLAKGRYGVQVPYEPVLADLSNNVSLNNINTTVLQSSVSTIVAPTNARERYYYALLAKGRYGVKFPYDLTSDVSLNNLKVNNLQKQIEVIKNPTPTDITVYRVLNIKDSYVARGTASPNIVLSSNVNKFKIPSTNAAVFYTPVISNLQKQIEIIKNPAPTDAIIFDPNNLQKQIEIIKSISNNILIGKAQDNYVARGTASSNIILLSNVIKLKVPNTNTEVFYSPISSNLQKQIEVIKGGASSNNIILGKAQDNYVARGTASSNIILLSNIIKLKLPSTNTVVFYSPIISNLQKQIEVIKNPTPTDAIIFDPTNLQKQIEIIKSISNNILIGKAQDNYVARGTASPNNILTNSLQKQVEIVKTPTPKESAVYYIANVNKFTTAALGKGVVDPAFKPIAPIQFWN